VVLRPEQVVSVNLKGYNPYFKADENSIRSFGPFSTCFEGFKAGLSWVFCTKTTLPNFGGFKAKLNK
jgi:hypothetical protein